jgi:benzodiazapine receptor
MLNVSCIRFQPSEFVCLNFTIKKMIFLYIGLTLLAAVGGAVITRRSIDSGYYDTLKKPDWTPPKYVYPIVWTVLYIYVGWAAYMLDKNSKSESDKNKFRLIFIISIVLNFLWTYLFFGRKDPKGASYVIVLMNIVNIVWLYNVYKKGGDSEKLGITLYSIWVFIASILNFQIVGSN